jgi:hypothetical protein
MNQTHTTQDGRKITVYWVKCAHCGRLGNPGIGSLRESHTRTLQSGNGWRKVRGELLCPDCQ